MIENTTETPGSMQADQSKPLVTNKGLTTGLATAAVVGVGAALIEVEWIPGLLLGVAAMVAPELVPKVGRGIRPFVHSAIKNGYAATRKTREWMAEAGEQVSDMVAEVRAASMEDESTVNRTTQYAAAVQPAAGSTSFEKTTPTGAVETAGAPAKA